ncbi:hypothetical protein ISN44_As11g004250 [Arabidopsis suecica]|uniref:Uncharacterized protein n=1 Tax=Arabidopsis suecica TaxID=45249 RepID=A0A8T1Z6F4_ARASU|nr:hypothetical protein ISN44_As11g004250 [Arabidopsis suecica]
MGEMETRDKPKSILTTHTRKYEARSGRLKLRVLPKLNFKKRSHTNRIREAFSEKLREEKELRHALSLRQPRVVPYTAAELIDYFLDSQAQEVEYEIARF